MNFAKFYAVFYLSLVIASATTIAIFSGSDVDRYGNSYYDSTSKTVFYEYKNIKYSVEATDNKKICAYDKNVFKVTNRCDSDANIPLNQEINIRDKGTAYINVSPEKVIRSYGDIKITAK